MSDSEMNGSAGVGAGVWGLRCHSGHHRRARRLEGSEGLALQMSGTEGSDAGNGRCKCPEGEKSPLVGGR